MATPFLIGLWEIQRSRIVPHPYVTRYHSAYIGGYCDGILSGDIIAGYNLLAQVIAAFPWKRLRPRW